jgi:hypothetical protein
MRMSLKTGGLHQPSLSSAKLLRGVLPERLSHGISPAVAGVG